MPLVPDVAGFKAAQDRLIDVLGEDVVFLIPQTATWPPGTPLDDTGRPYDPTVDPVSGDGFDEITKHCGVIVKPPSQLRPQDDVQTSPGGNLSDMDIIVTVRQADFAAVQNAARLRRLTKTFAVVEWKDMATVPVAFTPDRWIVYGELL